MIYFTAHTFKCVCHFRRAMFRVLGMYNFAIDMEKCFARINKNIFEPDTTAHILEKRRLSSHFSVAMWKKDTYK